MSTEASRLFAEGYLTGFFDMVATMVSGEASFELNRVDDADAAGLAQRVEGRGALIQASVEGGGAVAVLLPAEDVYKISAAFLGEEATAKDPVVEEDLPGLTEVYEPCLGAGVSFFKEKYGEVIVLENVQVLPGGGGAADGLSGLMGEACVAAEFGYRAAPDIESAGVLVFTKNLEGHVPSDAGGEAPEEAGGLERGEVDQILTSVGIPEAPDDAGAEEAAPNLDMVLDIGLVVKARLGRVEMPISEVLSLGPGSIIEVGHLVDDPIELLVNDKLIARGDVVVVDEKFGLRITEIVSPRERIESLR